MTRRTLLTLGAVLVLGSLGGFFSPLTLGAQIPGGQGLPAAGSAIRGATTPSTEQPESLERTVTRFARAFAAGNAEQVAGLMAAGGIRLRLEGLDRSALSNRQAGAALRDFLRGYEAGEMAVVRAAPVAGTPGRAFAELRWQTRVTGTSAPVVRAVFLGLVEENGNWRVDELRLLP